MALHEWARIGVESVRRAIRLRLGSESRLYKFGAGVMLFMKCVSREGLGKYRLLMRLQNGPADLNSQVPVTLSTIDFPLWVRPGTPDIITMINNLVREEYGDFRVASPPAWIIDAGAYIGDTAAYFLSRFPQAKLIALEPNPENFVVASKNLKPYAQRATLLRKALAAEEGTAHFGGNFTGGSIQAKGFEVECTTIPAILKQWSIPRLGILKLDIEGAEESVLMAKSTEWLDLVDLLIIEFHSASVEERIVKVLTASGFSMRKVRSVWYCKRNKPASPAV